MESCFDKKEGKIYCGDALDVLKGGRGKLCAELYNFSSILEFAFV